MGGRSSQRLHRTIVVVLTFILLRTLFALIWDVIVAGAKNDCYPSFAQSVFDQRGAEAIGLAKYEPDRQFATVGYVSESFIVLDMGSENEIIDQQGIDFYYYERYYDPGILLDRVEVAVAQDNGSGKPTPFIVVFIWGDEDPENNDGISLAYIPEDPNKPIDSSDLHNTTGIGIDIGNDDGAAYRFIRFQTHPTDAVPVDDELVEVDAVEKNCPPTPTLTPTPIDTPSPTHTPTPSETSTPIVTTVPYTSTLTHTDTPWTETYTPTLTLTAPDTQTSTVTLTLTATSTLTIQTETYTPRVTLTATDTPTSIVTATSTVTFETTGVPTEISPTNTLTVTLTPTATNTVTHTQTNNSTPMNTPIPTATWTRRSKATKTPTRTPIPYTPDTSEIVLTPLPTNTPTRTFTATLTNTLTAKKTQTPIATFMGMNTQTTPNTTPIAPIETPPRVFITYSWMPTKSDFDGIGITLIIGVITILLAVIQIITQIMPTRERTKIWNRLTIPMPKLKSKNKDTQQNSKEIINKAKNKNLRGTSKTLLIKRRRK